jgi:hypothetical protein
MNRVAVHRHPLDKDCQRTMKAIAWRQPANRRHHAHTFMARTAQLAFSVTAPSAPAAAFTRSEQWARIRHVPFQTKVTSCKPKSYRRRSLGDMTMDPAWGTVIDGVDPTRFPSSDPMDGRRGARLHHYISRSKRHKPEYYDSPNAKMKTPHMPSYLACRSEPGGSVAVAIVASRTTGC